MLNSLVKLGQITHTHKCARIRRHARTRARIQMLSAKITFLDVLDYYFNPICMTNDKPLGIYIRKEWRVTNYSIFTPDTNDE